MPDLSPEELQRIKLEELKKIEEIERENREKKLRLQEELRRIEEEKKGAGEPAATSQTAPGQELDKVREEIRAREMAARGYIQVNGQWVLRDDAERQEEEREKKRREEDDKKQRARDRKIEREKATYEEYKATVIIPIKAFAITIYVGLALMLVGGIMAIVGMKVRSLMTTLFFPGMSMFVMGAIALAVFVYMLVDAEGKLIERSFIILDNERIDFEDEEALGDYVRKAARSVARKLDSKLNFIPEGGARLAGSEKVSEEEDES